MNTYNFYTKKGERLAAFLLKHTDEGSVAYIYRCSLQDPFNKKAIRKAFMTSSPLIQVKGKSEELHPEIIKFGKVLSNKEFYKYLSDRYYRKVPRLCASRATFLVQKNKQILLDIAVSNKLSHQKLFTID